MLIERFEPAARLPQTFLHVAKQSLAQSLSIVAAMSEAQTQIVGLQTATGFAPTFGVTVECVTRKPLRRIQNSSSSIRWARVA